MTEDTVTITRDHYESLVEDSNILMKLESHGVDNWIGYEDAIRDYEGLSDD